MWARYYTTNYASGNLPSGRVQLDNMAGLVFADASNPDGVHVYAQEADGTRWRLSGDVLPDEASARAKIDDILLNGN